MNEIDLSKLNRRFYFFDELENKELIEILQNHFGEYIKIFDIEVTYNSFKFNTLWRLDERFGNEIRKFEMSTNCGIPNSTYPTFLTDKVLFNKVYDFLIQKEIRSERNLKLREIGI